jgi:hypothetical protein
MKPGLSLAAVGLAILIVTLLAVLARLATAGSGVPIGR